MKRTIAAAVFAASLAGSGGAQAADAAIAAIKKQVKPV